MRTNRKQPIFEPLAGEEWRDTGLGGYQASSLGRVLSNKRCRNGRPKIVLGHVDADGYVKLSLSLEGGLVITVKRPSLIARTFLGAKPDGTEVAHENGIPSDDRADNLRYKTPQQNIHDKLRHGTMVRGEMCHTAKLTEAQAIEVFHSTLRHKDIASQYGISVGNVECIKYGKSWKHLNLTGASGIAASSILDV